MPFVSPGLSDLYQRKQSSPAPEQTGGHALSFLWDLISPETHKVFDKYMGGQYENSNWQDVAADFLPENPWAMAQPNALGMTKILGAPGGNRLIQSFHDKTGELLGTLGYKDFPGKGAVFQSLQSQKPRATAELLTRFSDEMGPLMNDVKVKPPIMPQAVPNFQSWINRGRLDEWPDLKGRLQDVLDASKQEFKGLIPENTYASRQKAGGQWGIDPERNIWDWLPNR